MRTRQNIAGRLKFQQYKRNYALLVIGAGCSLAAMPSEAANPEFQDFFTTACISPIATLATRCAETDGGLGDLSSDSESSLNPSQTLSGGDASIYAAQQLSQELRERLASRRDARDEDETQSPRVDLGPFSLLINARSGRSETDRVVDLDDERGYELDETHAEIGLDYRFSDNLVWGAWINWGTTNLEFDRELGGDNFAPLADAGEIESDRYGLTTYVSAAVGKSAYIDAALGYSRISQDRTRNSVFQESNRSIAQTNAISEGSTDATELFVSVSTGYAGHLSGWNINPFVGLTYMNTNTDDYTETDISGSGLALYVDVDSQSVATGQLGVSISRAISMDGWVLVPQARVEYLVEFDRDRSSSAVSFINDTANTRLQLRGDSHDDNRIDVAVGLAGVLQNGWIPFIEYQFTTANDHLDRYQISAGIRIEL